MDQVDAPVRLTVLLKRRARLRRLYARSDVQIAAELERYSHRDFAKLDEVRGLLVQEVGPANRRFTPILDTPG